MKPGRLPARRRKSSAIRKLMQLALAVREPGYPALGMAVAARHFSVIADVYPVTLVKKLCWGSEYDASCRQVYIDQCFMLCLDLSLHMHHQVREDVAHRHAGVVIQWVCVTEGGTRSSDASFPTLSQQHHAYVPLLPSPTEYNLFHLHAALLKGSASAWLPCTRLHFHSLHWVIYYMLFVRWKRR